MFPLDSFFFHFPRQDFIPWNIWKSHKSIYFQSWMEDPLVIVTPFDRWSSGCHPERISNLSKMQVWLMWGQRLKHGSTEPGAVLTPGSPSTTLHLALCSSHTDFLFLPQVVQQPGVTGSLLLGAWPPWPPPSSFLSTQALSIRLPWFKSCIAHGAIWRFLCLFFLHCLHLPLECQLQANMLYSQHWTVPSSWKSPNKNGIKTEWTGQRTNGQVSWVVHIVRWDSCWKGVELWSRLVLSDRHRERKSQFYIFQ